MRQSVPAVARGLGAEVSEVGKVDELAACLAPLAGRVPGDPLVVHVAVSSRTENVARHDRLHEAVAAAVRGALA